MLSTGGFRCRTRIWETVSACLFGGWVSMAPVPAMVRFYMNERKMQSNLYFHRNSSFGPTSTFYIPKRLIVVVNWLKCQLAPVRADLHVQELPTHPFGFPTYRYLFYIQCRTRVWARHSIMSPWFAFDYVRHTKIEAVPSSILVHDADEATGWCARDRLKSLHVALHNRRKRIL